MGDTLRTIVLGDGNAERYALGSVDDTSFRPRHGPDVLIQLRAWVNEIPIDDNNGGIYLPDGTYVEERHYDGYLDVTPLGLDTRHAENIVSQMPAMGDDRIEFNHDSFYAGLESV